MLSSHERKYVGFQLCGSLLPSLSAQEVGVVLSPNLLGCLMNNSQSAENYLFPAARHLVSHVSMPAVCLHDVSLCMTGAGGAEFLYRDLH